MPIRKTRVLLPVLFVLAASALCAHAAEDPAAIAAEAFGLRLDGRVDEAVEMLEAGVGDHPRAGVLHYELARAKLLLLDIPGTLAAAESAVDCAPDSCEYRYFAAMAAAYSLIDAAHHDDRDRMKAMGRRTIGHLEAALRADPDCHRARYLLVQQSVEMAPQIGLEVADPEPHVVLIEGKDPIMGAKARCCLVVDKKEQRKIWEKILEDHPDDERALVEAAEGLITAGDLVLAAACIEKAIEKNAENSYGLLRLGHAHAMRGDWERARILTHRYLDHEPPVALKAYATARLGMIHHRTGDQDRARELMDEARGMDPHVWMTVMPPPKEIFTPL